MESTFVTKTDLYGKTIADNRAKKININCPNKPSHLFLPLDQRDNFIDSNVRKLLFKMIEFITVFNWIVPNNILSPNKEINYSIIRNLMKFISF